MPDLSIEEASRFVAAAGLVLDEVSGARVLGHMDLGADHHTPWGIVHGGIYATAVETAASVGASAAVADRGQYAVGVHNSTDFLRASVECRATVVAEPTHQGRSQQLWTVTVADQDGRQLARGQVRLRNIECDRFSH
ncbi:PaaI family thioesterase [Streptacidiphilus sp. NEAU-YB345]|uniref:PaaI family thioesterase n=2 Tax=Streptacidiphilus fuscans TaxID=2789292 RepID=A0A931AY61_9ACTN|nr:PaaI family thioesterase [Streptacidiphilus fuscans]